MPTVSIVDLVVADPARERRRDEPHRRLRTAAESANTGHQRDPQRLAQPVLLAGRRVRRHVAHQPDIGAELASELTIKKNAVLAKNVPARSGMKDRVTTRVSATPPNAATTAPAPVSRLPRAIWRMGSPPKDDPVMSLALTCSAGRTKTPSSGLSLGCDGLERHRRARSARCGRARRGAAPLRSAGRAPRPRRCRAASTRPG